MTEPKTEYMFKDKIVLFRMPSWTVYSSDTPPNIILDQWREGASTYVRCPDVEKSWRQTRSFAMRFRKGRVVLFLLIFFVFVMCLIAYYQRVNNDSLEVTGEDKEMTSLLLHEQNVLRLIQTDTGIPRDSPDLVDVIRRKWLISPPGSGFYNLSDPSKTDFSRGQSEVILSVSGKKTGGFFVDIGVGDGERNSVTLLLERQYNWTGILVEAQDDPFSTLVTKRRNAHLLHADVHWQPFAIDHTGKLKQITDLRSASISLPVYSITLAAGRTNVDLLNLNVADRTMGILTSFPFSEIDVDIVVLEFLKEEENEIINRMTSHGYFGIKMISNLVSNKHDLIFQKKRNKR